MTLRLLRLVISFLILVSHSGWADSDEQPVTQQTDAEQQSEGTAVTQSPAVDQQKAAPAAEPEPKESCKHQRMFVFSWQFSDGCDMQPRGGTTQGTPVTLDSEPHAGWAKLNQPGLSKRERDRQAILAMAGSYRVSFDFIETMGFEPDFKPDAPYQSWATEQVYVLADEPEFISLQHIIVMFFMNDGKVIGPLVTKHWRQDWQYEKTHNLVYQGNETWQTIPLHENEVPGSWSQAVYQVDDSPRYESYGYWQHEANFSRWRSQLTWRPLPRREFSVRSDYQVLEGYNSHTIVPDGWVHEEENYKLRIDNTGQPMQNAPYLAKELGLNRYQAIVGHDFSAGDQYWQATKDYWAMVRAKWQQVIDRHGRIHIKTSVDNTMLFYALFQFADELQQGKRKLDSAAKYLDQIFNDYVRLKQEEAPSAERPPCPSTAGG